MTGAARSSQSVLTIDLDAVAENYGRIVARLTPGCASGAVIKADAYGLGAARVGPALAAGGCKHFFVAHLGEGLVLRRALPASAAIYVLNGVLPGEEAEFRDNGLAPTLNDPAQVLRWSAAARAAGRRLPAVLHVDTGMSRLGLTPAEARTLADDRTRLAGLEVQWLISHLASSETPDHPLNAQQLAAFRGWRTAFPGLRGSLANSSGVYLGPDYHFDLVRPGAALAGINPLPGHANPMRQTVRLSGKILQIREVDPPATVGYGATHRIAARSRIATVAAGYADGWPRTLSNRGSGVIGNVRVPVVGRVSMDLITLDITAAPLTINPGDEVELLGPTLTSDDVAESAGTIAYELLTNLGPRYHRVYLGGTAVVNPLALIGRGFLGFLEVIGRISLFTATATSHCFRPPWYPSLIIRQMIDIGYYSLPVVGLTALFTGMVLALQSYTGFARFSAEGAVATVVVLSVTRELGPVIAGLMVAGRIGASMAAEIGTMRVTEQIDALTTLSTNPFKYLVAPRLIAGLTMLPLLVLVADVIGVLGGYLVAAYKLNFNHAAYLKRTFDYLEFMDVFSGLVKAAVFGFMISLLGCYHGYNSEGGAQGVGRATTNAVVSSSIMLLIFDYILTEIFFATK